MIKKVCIAKPIKKVFEGEFKKQEKNIEKNLVAILKSLCKKPKV